MAERILDNPSALTADFEESIYGEIFQENQALNGLLLLQAALFRAARQKDDPMTLEEALGELEDLSSRAARVASIRKLDIAGEFRSIESGYYSLRSLIAEKN